MAIICASENGGDGWICNSSEFGGVGARRSLEITTAGKPQDVLRAVELGDVDPAAATIEVAEDQPDDPRQQVVHQTTAGLERFVDEIRTARKRS